MGAAPGVRVHERASGLPTLRSLLQDLVDLIFL